MLVLLYKSADEYQTTVQKCKSYASSNIENNAAITLSMSPWVFTVCMSVKSIHLINLSTYTAIDQIECLSRLRERDNGTQPNMASSTAIFNFFFHFNTSEKKLFAKTTVAKYSVHTLQVQSVTE